MIVDSRQASRILFSSWFDMCEYFQGKVAAVARAHDWERIMNHQSRLPISILVVIVMSLFAVDPASGQDWNPAERAELLDYARATWRSFDAMTDRNGLTSDHLQGNAQGEWKPSQLTSPTDIASYLWSVLAARSLDLIDDAETDRRLRATLTMLERMDRQNHFYYNLYDVKTGARVDQEKFRPSSAFLSSVDNAWLAVALTMVRNARPELRDRAETLVKPMDFGFFYVPFDPTNPLEHPGQFHGGYNTVERQFTAFYGMLNTEPRIISYLALARKQVPAEHYYRMFRTLPVDRAPQSQRPQGVTRTYLGVPVFEGHYQFRELDLVPTWGGSMFEALMVPLFVPEETWAPRSWGINHPLYVRAQIEQGLIVRSYGAWGFSPSWTPEGGYQTYGVADIGTEVDGYRTFELSQGDKPKRGKPTGPVFEGVVTAHASFLAMRYAPRESLRNLRSLKQTYPMFTPTEGFHDSVNVTTGAVSHCVLSLDQGMILAAIANTLADDVMRKWLCDGSFEAAIRPLIEPEEFTAGDRRP